jgi:hypothetical protein
MKLNKLKKIVYFCIIDNVNDGCSKDSGDTLDLENNHMARSESVLLKLYRL